MASLRDRLKSAVPDGLTSAVRSGLVQYGVHTSDRRPLPDFLIIGAKRGGTTSLWNYLIEHPLVPRLFPAWNTKTSHFFEGNWTNGVPWYRSHFPTQRQRFALERRHGGASRVGEAAPMYMFHPLAPQRVREVVPDVRLIVLLRDPVERAYSHWKERRTNDVEPLDFADALVAEGERTAGELKRLVADPSYVSHAYDWYSYRARGRYLEHLAPWLDTFDRSQFLFVPSEDLYSQPSLVYARTLEFLDLPPFDPGDFRVYNDRPSAPMDSAIRSELTHYYHPYNTALAERLDMTFRWAVPEI